MRIAGINKTSLVDGKGLNYVIYFQGCDKDCKGCHNPSTHDMNAGKAITFKELTDDIKKNVPPVTGVTFSGGEPLLQFDDIYALACWAKNNHLNTMLYTGRKITDVVDALNRIGEVKSPFDYVMDGEFELCNKTDEKPFRGSSNQKYYEHVIGLEYKVVS